jgi:hypothetical protein
MNENEREREILAAAERYRQELSILTWRLATRTCFWFLMAGAVLTAITWLGFGEIYLPE